MVQTRVGLGCAAHKMRQNLVEHLQSDRSILAKELEVEQALADPLQAIMWDIAVLDEAMASGLPPFHHLSLLREAGWNIPFLIMITDEAEGLSALEQGASDFIVKPFRFSTLVGRIKSLARRYEEENETEIMLGSCLFRPGLRTIATPQNDVIRLTEKEAAILHYLFRIGQSVSRETLLSEVWGYQTGVTSHTLETHIYRLRRKIEIDSDLGDRLITDQGGYKLLA